MTRITMERQRHNLSGPVATSARAYRRGPLPAVLQQLNYQAGHAVVWRDAVCKWFYRMSKIPDVHGRVGNHPNRIEAEAMTLEGYTEAEVSPWETASGGKAVVCGTTRCTAGTQFAGKAGWYDVTVDYFDQNNGASKFELLVNGQRVEQWSADKLYPTFKPDGHSSTRRTVPDVALRPGDEIRIVGYPNEKEQAPLDYVEITAARLFEPIYSRVE